MLGSDSANMVARSSCIGEARTAYVKVNKTTHPHPKQPFLDVAKTRLDIMGNYD